MTVSADVQKMRKSSPNGDYDVIIVGAGPYGLATAAHMRQRGLRIAIFGKPMALWRDNMPEGMLLRSYWWATNISDPQHQYGLKQYFQAHAIQEHDPLEAKTVIDYGLWFQRNVAPDLDETYVATVEKQDGRFKVTLVDGRILSSKAVVMAPGLCYYPHWPTEYQHLSPENISHTFDYITFDHLVGKQVIIIGGGQSALETAALAYESGVNVQVVSRRRIGWIKEFGSFPEHRPMLERLRRPKAGISPSWFNWLIEHFPYTFQRLPRSTRNELMRGPGRYGPVGAAWLKPRLEGKVPLHQEQPVQEIQETDAGVRLVLANQKALTADHIILGTGYRVDIRKLPMLHPALVESIQTYQDTPILSSYFESSVPGLYFIGISSASSCGPLFRFIVGTDAAARRVTTSASRQEARR